MSTEHRPKSQTKTGPPSPTRLASRFQVAWKTAAASTSASAKKVMRSKAPLASRPRAEGSIAPRGEPVRPPAKLADVSGGRRSKGGRDRGENRGRVRGQRAA